MLDFKTISIVEERDIKDTKEEFDFYFDNEVDFSPYQKLLETLNVIVGFGRGFWAGVHNCFYLIYSKNTNMYYWFLKNEDTEDVYFYRVDDNDPLFQLLETHPIDSFTKFDEALNYGELYKKSIGDSKTDEPIDLIEVFGEDSTELQIALRYFSPGGATYPHIEFHQKYFRPHFEKTLDKRIKKYNDGNFKVFRKQNKMFINLNGDVFELKKPSNWANVLDTK